MAGPPGRDRHAAPHSAVRGRCQGTRGPPPPPPPPLRPKSGLRQTEETAAPHPPRRGRCTRHEAAPWPRQTPARPARCRLTADKRRPGQRNQSGPFRGRPGEDGGANQGGGVPPPSPPPPPGPTDPLAADRTAPDARGCPATPTARVYPEGGTPQTTDCRPTSDEAGGRGGGPPSPPPPPPPPPQFGSHGSDPPPPRSRGGAPPPPEGTATRGGGGCGWTCTPRTPAPQAACSRGGRGRQSSPHQCAGATRGPSLRAAHGGAPEQYGGRAPNYPLMTTAHSGRAKGESGLQGPPGERSAGRPSSPRTPGRPHDPGRTRTPEGSALTTRGGPGWGTAGRDPEGEHGGRGATPPPPPTPPAARKPRGPRPPPSEAGGMVPPPPPERGAGARPASPPQPLGPTGTAENKRACANAPGRRTDRAQ